MQLCQTYCKVWLSIITGFQLAVETSGLLLNLYTLNLCNLLELLLFVVFKIIYLKQNTFLGYTRFVQKVLEL